MMSADLILARDATKTLFKANMAREARKKTKENTSGGAFRTPFGRVLTENEAIRLREDEIRKAKKSCRKK
jgi:hypothetical protein